MTSTIMHFLPRNTYGGIENQVLDVSSRLEEKQEYKNIIALPDEEGDLIDEVKNHGLEAVKIKYRLPKQFESLSALWWNIGWGMEFIPSVQQIRQEICRYDPDVVHINGLLLLQPGIAAELENIKVLWYLVSDNIYPHWLVRMLIPIINKLSIEVILISESNRDFYLQNNRDVTIIPGGIDVDQISGENITENRISDFWDKHGIDTKRSTIVTLSKVTKVKGQIYGIRAISKLNNKVNYLIVGPMQDEKYVAELRRTAKSLNVEDQVYITGFVNDKYAALKGSDVFLLPSLGEGTPLVIMEAFAMKLPVIAADVGGVRELLDHGRAGQIVPPKDPQAISSAIQTYLYNQNMSEKHTEVGHDRVYSNYNIDTIVTKYEEVYERVTQTN